MKSINYGLLLFFSGCSEPNPIKETRDRNVEYSLHESPNQSGEKSEEDDVTPSNHFSESVSNNVSEIPTPQTGNKFVTHENVPLDWLSQQNNFVRGQIEKGMFVLSIVNGVVRVGVADENGEFVYWPGSRTLPPGGSTGYLFLPSNPKRVPIRF